MCFIESLGYRYAFLGILALNFKTISSTDFYVSDNNMQIFCGVLVSRIFGWVLCISDGELEISSTEFNSLFVAILGLL